jgi:replicative superfamily II helicase
MRSETTPFGCHSQVSVGDRKRCLLLRAATMPNAEEVARWLGAAVYETDFRPIQLDRFLLVTGNRHSDRQTDRQVADGQLCALRTMALRQTDRCTDTQAA